MFNRKKQEEAVRSEGRLPPGQALSLKFPVLHYGPVFPPNPEALKTSRFWKEERSAHRGEICN